MRSLPRQQVGWKFALILLLTDLLAVALTVTAIRIDANRRQARETIVREQARAATCYLVLLQVRVFDENVPQTQTGRELAEAWRTAARVYGCQ